MGRPPRDRRVVINAIRWRVRTGSPWRDMPERYGPWETAYGLFRQRQRDGTWRDILTRLQAQADTEQIITWDVSSTRRCAGRTSTPPAPGKGADQKPSAGWGGHRTQRPRPRPVTRRAEHELHLACEQGQRPLSMLVTAGQAGDSPQFTAVLDGIRVPRQGSGRARTRLGPGRQGVQHAAVTRGTSLPGRPARDRRLDDVCAG